MMANGGEPFECGKPAFSIVFFVLFHILVFQIFVNLFIAIIIDAFLGQTDHFKLPVQEFSLSEFVRLWSFYDPEATGYIKVTDLEPLISDLMQSSDGKELVVLRDRLESDPRVLRRFVTNLTIPLYKQLSHVMFYDVL